jgi:hypothetical protein
LVLFADSDTIAANAMKHKDRSVILPKYKKGCGISLLLPCSAACDLAGEARQFSAINHLVIDQSDQQLFDRAAAKAINDLPYRFRRNAVLSLTPHVNIGSSFHPMLDIPFSSTQRHRDTKTQRRRNTP